MILYGVRWKDSQSKTIYKATKHSEYLMEYLEQRLFETGIVKDTGELPVDSPGRQYGVMLYYYKAKPRRILLTSAPRREHNHIHIEIKSRVIDRDTLQTEGFKTGNNQEPKVPDLLIGTEIEIDKLISLIIKNNFRLT
ncbi:hypothetical protein [Brevibacillus centrosporus]|uniref:hypothetical protein n=1 Tax=Brevibacillus centrosporus TaxID=54910 RepID=UPI003B0286C8